MREVLEYLKRTQGAMLALCEGLSAERACRPVDGKWNVDQHLEHLATAERGSLVGLKRALARGPATAEERAATAGKTEAILERVPVVRQRVEAPEIVRPTGRYGAWPGSLEAFRQARESTIAFAGEAAAEQLEVLVQPHPALGPLTGVQWLYFAGAHGERHRKHIEELLQGAD